LTASITVSNAAVAKSFTAGSTASISAANSAARFTNIGLEELENKVVLTASAPGLASAFSVPFNVVPADGYPIKVNFGVSPNAAVAERLFDLQPVVHVLDFSGNLVEESSAMITVSVVGGDNALGSLVGVSSLSAIVGEVIFSGLSINRAGIGYKLEASSPGLASDTTDAFTVTGPYALEFVTQPSTDNVNYTTAQSFEVKIAVKNVDNNILLTGQNKVSLSLQSAGKTVVFASDAAPSKNSVNGYASFPTLSVSTPGRYFILAVCGQVRASSDFFTIVQATTPAPAPKTDDKKDDKPGILKRTGDAIAQATGLSIGAIIGIVIGVLVVVVIFIVVLVSKRVSKARKNQV
jgi:hypothetical protein